MSCRCLKLEERVLDLESKLQNRNKEFESLELRFKELECENLKLKDSNRVDDEESLIEQMMVNTTLEYEKQVAVKEAEDWKTKFEKLLEKIESDENLKSGLDLEKKTESCKVSEKGLSKEGLVYHQSADSPYVTTPAKDYNLGRFSDNVASPRRRVNKMLSFEDEGHKSSDVVELCDSDEEPVNGNATIGDKESDGEKYEDDDVDASTPLPGHKRKRVITSDSENDDEDDKIPITILKNLKPKNQDLDDTEGSGHVRLRRRRRRVCKQRVPEEISTSRKSLVGIPTTGNAEDDETEEESERVSESESLDGFIVDDDESVSEKSNETGEEDSDETGEEESDGETGYAHVISRLRRDKNNGKQRKWEYEADMLADFGKDPELCMRAVCVLYMFQTEDEKATRSSHVCNGRGFSKFDAVKGTRIGRFLTDGDPEGDLKKSVEELKRFDSGAVETCRDLASKYSNQLFQIYNNREVPFFAAPPSP